MSATAAADRRGAGSVPSGPRRPAELGPSPGRPGTACRSRPGAFLTHLAVERAAPSSRCGPTARTCATAGFLARRPPMWMTSPRDGRVQTRSSSSSRSGELATALGDPSPGTVRAWHHFPRRRATARATPPPQSRSRRRPRPRPSLCRSRRRVAARRRRLGVSDAPSGDAVADATGVARPGAARLLYSSGIRVSGVAGSIGSRPRRRLRLHPGPWASAPRSGWCRSGDRRWRRWPTGSTDDDRCRSPVVQAVDRRRRRHGLPRTAGTPSAVRRPGEAIRR